MITGLRPTNFFAILTPLLFHCAKTVSEPHPFHPMTLLFERKQIPRIVVTIRNSRKPTEPLEPIALSWAQGVGRSNRPAPTKLPPDSKEVSSIGGNSFANWTHFRGSPDCSSTVGDPDRTESPKTLLVTKDLGTRPRDSAGRACEARLPDVACVRQVQSCARCPLGEVRVLHFSRAGPLQRPRSPADQ